MRLIDRYAVIMGVADVVEQACALRFAREGASIALVDPDEHLAERTRAQINAEGGRAIAFSCDMADEAAVKEIAAILEQRWGRVDILINTIGTVSWGSIEHADVSDWIEVFRQGAIGPMVCSKTFLPLLRKGEASAIINLGSIDGIFGNPQVPSYSAAKGALIPLTHCLAEELGPSGIRVNMIARGGSRSVPVTQADVASGRVADSAAHAEQFFDGLIEHTPLRRLADGSEFAAAALFLASADAAYVTGSILTVDGGRTAITPGTRRHPAAPK